MWKSVHTLLKSRLGPRLNQSKRTWVLLSTSIGTVGFANIILGSDSISKPLVQDEDDRLPLVYNVEEVQKYWHKRPIEVLSRTLQILQVALPYLSKLFLWEFLIRGKIQSHEGLQKKYAILLRENLTQLGPSFIKFGQAMSIRPDLLPTSFLFELQKLCDEVPSFPTEDAIQVIEQEFGEKVSEIFLDLNENTRPIAAASLGQVYKLRLKKGNEEVAVKVQRPDMVRFVLRDLYIMRCLARVFEKVKGLVTNQRAFDVALLDTFAAASLQELDYCSEAANQERFRQHLLPKTGWNVYIPEVFHDYTTRKVLVTEWVDGVKLASSPKEVINKLVPVGLECFLIQLLEIGFFHADPHPGNLLVTTDGRLALIDFGLCAEVPLPDTKTMTLAIVHLMQGDINGMIDDAIQLNFLPPNVNRESLYNVLKLVYDNATLAMQDEIRQAAISKTKFKAVATRRKKFMAVSSDLNKVFFEFPFYVPEYFALITRALIVLEGIALSGDPEFDLFASAYPYAFKRAVQLFGISDLSQIASEAVKARYKSLQNAQTQN